MRVVYPTDENIGFLSKRGAHFGKAKFYTIITIEDGQMKDVEVVKNQGHSSGGCGNAVTNIMDLNPDALVVSGIGASPVEGFTKVGLDVYFDKESATVQEGVTAFINGSVQKINSGTCSAH